MDDYHI